VHLIYLNGLTGALAPTQLRDFIRYADQRGYWTDALGRYLLAALLKHRGKPAEAKRELEQVLSMATAYGNRHRRRRPRGLERRLESSAQTSRPRRAPWARRWATPRAWRSQPPAAPRLDRASPRAEVAPRTMPMR
jgi:hypothetical protein